jgi:hypothetical protein
MKRLGRPKDISASGFWQGEGGDFFRRDYAGIPRRCGYFTDYGFREA